jgi:hypothetical protein
MLSGARDASRFAQAAGSGGMPVPGGARYLSIDERKRLMKQHKELRDAEWLERYRNTPQRPHELECTADGDCFYRGVQASLLAGQGLVFCRDCADPHSQGLFVDTWEAAHGIRAFHVDAGMYDALHVVAPG